MKKILAILLSLCLIFCLAACGNAPEPAVSTEKPSGNETEPETEMQTEPETETEEEGVSLAEGDSGVGPCTIDTPIYTIEVPAGVEYKVYSWYFDEESKRGTIDVGFNREESSSQSVSLKFNTGAMVSSYEDAIETSIGLNNLDTYTEGKYEMGAEVTYGPLTYQAYHTSTEYGEEDYLVSFLDFYGGMYLVEVNDWQGSGFISDPVVAEILSSMILK